MNGIDFCKFDIRQEKMKIKSQIRTKEKDLTEKEQLARDLYDKVVKSRVQN